MKKLFVAGLTGAVLLAPAGIGHAANGMINYTSCMTTSEGKTMSTMQVRVDNYVAGYTDANGCLTMPVSDDVVHDISFRGEKSMLNAVPDTNGFEYIFTYRTDLLTSDTSVSYVIPVTPVLVEVNGVDGVPVPDPVLALNGGGTLTMPDSQIMNVRVRGDRNLMTGAGNYVLFGVIDGLPTQYTIDTPPNTGYEKLTKILPLTTGTAFTDQAVLQYPAPATVDDVSYTVTPNGEATAYWTPAPGTSKVNVYRNTDNGPVFLAEVPGTATSFDIGQLPAKGAYGYSIRAANQYGYEGNAARGLQVIWDDIAPVVSHVSIDSTDIDVGSTTMFNVKFLDNESGLSSHEYFVDTDPGNGNGIGLGQTDEFNVFRDEFGSDLAVGTHTIGVRASDQNGNWSQTVYLTLTVHEAPVTPEEPTTEE